MSIRHASNAVPTILMVACHAFGAVYCGTTYAQSLICTPASDAETTARLTSPNNYVLLNVIYPDDKTREVVLYSNTLPFVLKSAGAIEGLPPKQYPALLSKAEAKTLMSAPIRLNRPLGRLTFDLAPDEPCPLGGVVEGPTNDVMWGTNITLDDVLARFFTPIVTEDGRLVGHELRKDFLSKLTCADIAALLRCSVSVHRSRSWWTIIVNKQRIDSSSAPAGCNDRTDGGPTEPQEKAPEV